MEVTDVNEVVPTATVPGQLAPVRKQFEGESQIYEFERLIAPEICDEIVLWFKTNPKLPTNGAQSFFDGKQINYEHIDNSRIKKLVNMFKYEATLKVREVFNVNVYPDYTDLVFWQEGSGMVVHADNCDQEGNPNYCSWRNYSGVLYLNDDYQGGNTFFPNHGPKFIIPSKGKFVFYPSGLDYSHGVTTVVGNRYTMPIWFTTDLNYIET